MSYPRLPMLVRPYLWNGMPFAGRVFKWLGLGGIDNVNPRWRGAPTKLGRGTYFNYLMELDLCDDVERFVFFRGHYYDIEPDLVIDAILKPGDTFIDAGANIGMITFHAASRVGPQGRVFSFEPQKSCCEKIKRQIARNNIKQIALHNIGLSDRPGMLTLNVLGGGSIAATFAINEAVDGPGVREKIEVPIARGDDIVGDQVVGNLLIKADVEGFELYVLRGFEKTIARHRPPILIEMEPTFLKKAGVDESEVFAFFRERDYRGYNVSLIGRWKSRRMLLRPLARPEDHNSRNDVLWLPATGDRFDPSPYMSQT
jgi:FkbM family methyltransferase